MSEIIGDTSHLHRTTVEFSAVHTVTGSSGHGHFELDDTPGFKNYVASHALVEIVSGSLLCEIISPPAAEKVTTATVAVVPSHLTNWPKTRAQIYTIGGAVGFTVSAYHQTPPSPLAFAVETSHTIKPSPLSGSTPAVVFQYSILGGTSTDEVHIRLRGQVHLGGVGFMQTW